MEAHNNTLENLGAKVAELSATLADQLRAGNHPQPSLSADGPASYPRDPKISRSQSQLLDTLLEMVHLVKGPAQYWAGITDALTEFMALSVLHQFDFFGAVPLRGTASYSEIAKATCLPEQMVRRFIRTALAMQLFAIDSADTDRITHTALSAQVILVPTLRRFLDFGTTEGPAMCLRGTEALRRYHAGRAEPNDDIHACPFILTHEPDSKERGLPIWEYFEKKPDQAKLFADALAHVNSMTSVGAYDALDLFDWGGLGLATVVDVGGSSGHVARHLAENHANLNFIVQDKPAVEHAFNANIPAELIQSGRLQFQPHDFFQPQEETADVYLVKSVLHDWPDASAIEILRNLIPALEKSKVENKNSSPRILLVDMVLAPEYDDKGNPMSPLHIRRSLAGLDMMLFTLCNARDRMMQDWLDIVEKVDKRLEMVKVYALGPAPMTVMELKLRDE